MQSQERKKKEWKHYVTLKCALISASQAEGKASYCFLLYGFVPAKLLVVCGKKASYLSDVDLSVLIIIVRFHEAGFQLHQHLVCQRLIGSRGVEERWNEGIMVSISGGDLEKKLITNIAVTH